MARLPPDELSLEQFQTLVEQAGLDLTRDELEHLKTLYGLYAEQVGIIHTVDLQTEEMGITFSPEWPSP
jgi:hypothetical protein